jgi:hypothetical protein
MSGNKKKKTKEKNRFFFSFVLTFLSFSVIERRAAAKSSAATALRRLKRDVKVQKKFIDFVFFFKIFK